MKQTDVSEATTLTMEAVPTSETSVYFQRDYTALYPRRLSFVCIFAAAVRT
jgi:hypothetical protein